MDRWPKKQCFLGGCASRGNLPVLILAFAVVWAVATVVVALVLWRSRDHPAVAVFLAGWMAAWMVFPLAVFDGGRVAKALRNGLPWPSPGRVSVLTKRLFCGGFVTMAAVTGLFTLGTIGEHIRRRPSSDWSRSSPSRTRRGAARRRSGLP